MKDIQYKCTLDQEKKFNIQDKILTSKHWKEFFLNCDLKCDIRSNIQALSGKDVLDYVSIIYKLKFDPVVKYLF